MPPIPLMKYHLDVQKACCLFFARYLMLFIAAICMCAKSHPHVQTRAILLEQKISLESPSGMRTIFFAMGCVQERGAGGLAFLLWSAFADVYFGCALAQRSGRLRHTLRVCGGHSPPCAKPNPSFERVELSTR